MPATNSIDVFAVFASLIGVVFSGCWSTMALGSRSARMDVYDLLSRSCEDRWIFNRWGPKYVLSVAYITAYGSLIMSLIGLI